MNPQHVIYFYCEPATSIRILLLFRKQHVYTPMVSRTNKFGAQRGHQFVVRWWNLSARIILSFGKQNSNAVSEVNIVVVCYLSYTCDTKVTLLVLFVVAFSGTFNSYATSRSDADCSPCTPGFYCEGVGNSAPTAKCFGGYYCNGSATSPTQYMSLPGNYAVVGSSEMSPCPPGSFTALFGQSSCMQCPGLCS